MYISVPKNYGGNAFPHPDTGEKRGVGAGMPRQTPPFAPFGAPPAAPPPRQIPHGGMPAPVAPLGKIPRDPSPPPPPPPLACGCEACGTEEACGNDGAESTQQACGEANMPPPCGAVGKNPLTCLFEALHGRKKGGFDADDFLLIGLIALLMGKEGNEDIVLILGLLLLV